jgi:hypothetical protein
MWEFFMFIVTIFYLFYIPVEVFYSVRITLKQPDPLVHHQWNILDKSDFPRGLFYFLCCVTFIEIMVKFNIGIYRRGMLVKNRKEIA